MFYWQLVGSGKKTVLPTSFSGHWGAREDPGNANPVETVNVITKSTTYFILNAKLLRLLLIEIRRAKNFFYTKQ